MGSHFNSELKNENTKINLILSQLGSHFNNELKNENNKINLIKSTGITLK